ncbi:MAG: cytochrome c biogenesis protein CcdA [bacterium]|nr:cytochrome c biogenesis protein CcdA [bacterium]
MKTREPKGRPAAAAMRMWLVLACACALALPAAAEPPPQLTVTLKALGGDHAAGGASRLGVVYHVPAGTHLTATFQGLVFASEPAAAFGPAVFPKPVAAEIPYYRGEVMALVPVTWPDRAGPVRVSLRAEYQLCREGDAAVCYQPGEAVAELELELAPAAAAAAADSPAALAAPAVPAASAAVAATGGGLQARLQHALERGSWLAFLMVFLGGVLASFTPCVYPMIPITISYIGGNARGRPLKGFVLSLWYVLGIALVYSTLGVAAAATGGAFGQATQTPVFAAIVAAIIGAMALSMAGLFDLQLPSSLTSRVGGGRTGFLGPLLMGAAMGLIAAPCVGPVLIVLLTWVATTGNLVLGFWLLFVFALGLGVLFVALGTFSGLLTALPGAGGWMQTVKHVFAIVLFALSLWFLRLYAPVWLLAAVFGLALLLCVSAWGAWRALPEGAGARAGLNLGGLRFLWLLGATLAILGGLRGLAPGLLPAGGAAPDRAAAGEGSAEPAWLSDDRAAFAAAREQGKPVMMDFWAAWCAACLELDERTYNQPEVLALAADFVAVKMDLTERSAANDELARRYGVVGMPTVLFFDPQGRELERFSGFVNARDLAVVLERVRRGAAGAPRPDPQPDREEP